MKRVTINGETHSLSEWAKIKEIPVSNITSRIHLGWTPRQAIETPRYSHDRISSDSLQDLFNYHFWRLQIKLCKEREAICMLETELSGLLRVETK